VNRRLRVLPLPLEEELRGGEIPERLVWADGVVRPLPALELPAVRVDGVRGDPMDPIELVTPRPVGPFDTPVESGALRGKDVQGNPPPLTLPLKDGLELAPAVDLEPADRHGHPLLEGIEETGRCPAGLSGTRLCHVPLRDDVPGAEVEAADAGEDRDGEGVHFHEVPRSFGYEIPGLRGRMGTPEHQATVFGVRPLRLHEETTSSEVPEAAAHGAGGDVPAFPTEQDRELLGSPARVLFPQRLHPRHECGRGHGWSDTARSARPLLECVKMPGIIPALPVIERVRRDAEVPTGAPGVPLVALVPIHPGETLLRSLGKNRDPGDPCGPGQPRAEGIHGDTVPAAHRGCG